MAQSYDNPGGSGDRRSAIEMTSTVSWAGSVPATGLIDGVMGDNLWPNAGQTERTITFDFRETRVIDEATWYQDSAATHGAWKWQGSNDGSTWTDIGGEFVLGGTAQTHDTLHGNTTAYRFYQLAQVSGGMSNAPYNREITFRIDDGTQHPNGYWVGLYGHGDRTSVITASSNGGIGGGGTADNLLDNDISTTTTGAIYYSNGQTGRILTFDFLTPVVVIEALWLFDVPASQGAWQWEGSDDASTWTAIGASFDFGGGMTSVISRAVQYNAQLAGNETAYRYYRVRQVSGATMVIPNILEVYFRTADGEAPEAPLRRRQMVIC